MVTPRRGTPSTTGLPSTARLEAFSDGVIAIAVTLLVVIYCASLAVISATFVALWTYLARRPQLLLDGEQQLPMAARRRALVGPVASTVAAGVAAVSAPAGFAACPLVAVYSSDRPRPTHGEPSGG